MSRLLALLILLSAGLGAQALTQLDLLEYRPTPQAGVSPRRPALDPRLPPPAALRLGPLRQNEMDAIPREPRLRLWGVERAIPRPLQSAGEWAIGNDGRPVWRAAIQSEGAAGIRLEFSGFDTAAGEVWIYAGDGTQVFGPYSGAGPQGTGEFWSHTVFAGHVVVEYQPALSRDGLPFRIAKLLHVFPWQQPTSSAAACELDISCYADWSAASSGVGLYLFQKGGASYACTGALVNNGNRDGTPYFLTAGHCVADRDAAATVNVFWNYQTPSCHAPPPSLGNSPQSLGATFLAGADMAHGDFSLLLLHSLPAVDLRFYGWNSDPAAVPVGAPLVGVHHPAADFKRIAFGVRDPDMTALVGGEMLPSHLYYQVRETSGRIEPGSSGSPLFSLDQVIVGTLTYGPPGDACTLSPFSAGYGRFSAAFPAFSPYLSGGEVARRPHRPAPPCLSCSPR